MPKLQKVQAVEELSQRFRSSSAIYFVEYKGLTVAEISVLRRKLKEKKAELKVAKNTLMRIALEQAELGKVDILTGPTGITAEVRSELVRLGAGQVVVLGGPAAVSDAIGRQAANPSVLPRPSSPDLDCPDFDSMEEAQATLDYWILQGLGDVHGLDADDDGMACESGV